MSPPQPESGPPSDLAAAAAALQKNPQDVSAALTLGGLLHDYGLHDAAHNIRTHTVYLLQQGIGNGVHPDQVCALLVGLYNFFVKKIETEQHARACFQSWLPMVAAYGRTFQDTTLPHKLWRSDAARPWRAAFFLFNATILGHTEALMELLAHRPKGPPWSERPIIYTFDGVCPPLDDWAAQHGVQMVNLQGEPLDPTQHLEKLRFLRRRIAQDGVSHLVWVSAPAMADFVLPMRLAPAQIFWTLKFHPYRLPEIDGYITYGAWSEERRFEHGEEWQVVPFMMSKTLPRVADSLVAEKRAKFAQHDVLFGTLARTEKINSAPFLDAVVRILRENPKTGYLWTGREQHGGIQACFQQAGVADRCHFIGWVETPVYARVLDVFLESFPFGCGLTGMQALEAGTAFLSYAAPETQYGMHFLRPLAENGSAATTIRSLLDPQDGTAPLLYPDNAGDYVALAGRLARDTEFRRAAGLAGQRYYREYLTDSGRMGERFFTVLAATKKPEDHGV